MGHKKLIDVYPYAMNSDDIPEFLILKRSAQKIYAGQWRIVGGKVRENESFYQAALREFREETGIIPIETWTVPSVNTFYEYSTDQIHHIPAFAFNIERGSTIKYNDEHIEHTWIKASDAEKYLTWPEQVRLIKLVNTIITDPNWKILDEWVISNE